jgi:Flp pilus assembly secretin CpaC
MRDTTTEDVGKVPFLGDIPLIGRLFRHTSTRSVKTNLLLLLTPYIIRDTEDFHAIFRRKMEEREEFLAFFGRRDAAFMAAVDYARKDGPMQSIFETINEAVETEEARRRAFSDTTREITVPAPTNAPMRPNFDAEPSEPRGLLNSSDVTAP